MRYKNHRQLSFFRVILLADELSYQSAHREMTVARLLL